jgi:DNA-binding NarL/FixJ family response regulator
MPGLHGLEVTRRVRRRSPQTAVVVLSRYAHEPYVVGAFENGASGYVTHLAEAGELLRAVHAAVRRSRYVSAPLSPEIVEHWLERARRGRPDPYDALTERERQVLKLVAEGRSSAGIARQLAISRRTAEAHRANLMRKLHLKNTAELVRFALERGILPPLDRHPSRDGRPRPPAQD